MQSEQTKTNKIHTFSEVAHKRKSTLNNLAAGTKDNYIKSLNFWVNLIGDNLITQISYSKILIIANLPGWKSKNRNNMLIPLRKVFEAAYLDDLISHNPTLKLKTK